MINTSLLLAYIVAVCVLLITPGPVVALIVGTTSNQGKQKAFFTALGTNAASLVLIALASLILTGLVSVGHAYLYALGMLGSLYIAYTSIMHLIHLKKQASDATQVPPKKYGGFVRGFLTAISNPKDILFFASFFPQFIFVTPTVGVSLALLCVVWIVLDLSILSAYILVVHHLIPDKYNKWMEVASCVILVIIAVLGFAYNLRALMA